MDRRYQPFEGINVPYQVRLAFEYILTSLGDAENLLTLFAAPGSLGTRYEIGEEPLMGRKKFDEYIRRFNDEDPTAFDDYLAPDVQMLNGALEFSGIEGMRDHYESRIWPYFIESLPGLKFYNR